MNKEQLSSMNELLKSEVVPAIGCTGPIAIAYAAAEAKDAVGGTVKKVTIYADKDMCSKNDDVGIPKTHVKGLKMAASLGAIAGNAAAKLEVLKNVTEKDEEEARAFAATEDVSVIPDWETEALGIYIDARVETDLGTGRAIVAKSHSNVVYKAVNDKVLVDRGFDRNASLDESHDDISKYSLADLYDFAVQCDVQDLAWLKEAVSMNKALADESLSGKSGVRIGASLLKNSGGDMVRKASAMAAAGAEARMGGLDMPAMTCSTSGNAGITGAMTMYSLAQDLGKDEEELLRALALCYFTTAYGKHCIGRHSVMCACAVAASCGVAAGTSLLLGGGLKEVQNAISNTILNVFGVMCDGARYGCALKLASAAGIAIEGAFLAKEGIVTPANEGVTCADGEATMKFMGDFAKNGMRGVDLNLCKFLYGKESPVA